MIIANDLLDRNMHIKTTVIQTGKEQLGCIKKDW